MRSDSAIVGRVIGTEPFSVYEWERTSLLVVEAVIFGAVSEGDTVKVAWRSNRCDNPDGSYSEIVCGGGSQLSELEGQALLWMISGRNQVVLTLPPIDVLGMTESRVVELAAIADGTQPPRAGVPLPYKDIDELESDPDNLNKCELVSLYLRESAEY